MNEANAYSVESNLASNSFIKQVLALSKYYILLPDSVIFINVRERYRRTGGTFLSIENSVF